MTEFTVSRSTQKMATWEAAGQQVYGRIQPTPRLKEFASNHGIPIQELLDTAKASPVASAASAASAGPIPPLTLSVRHIHSDMSTAKEATDDDPIEAFRQALGLYPDCESVISWKGTRRLALLDVDYHGTEAPPRHRALTLLAKLRPVPFASWVSHGGGLHALYREQDGLTAEEIASCAAIQIKSSSPTCTVEVISRTRHPLSIRPKGESPQRCSEVTFRPQSLDSLVAQWRGVEFDEVSEEDVELWLANRGMRMDERFDHTFCPFDPCVSPGNPPVVARGEGVNCFRCTGTGHTSGGFAPWEKLISGRKVNRIVDAANVFVPWDHAKYIIQEDYGDRVPAKVLRLVYSALCKAIHGADHPNIRRLSHTFQLARGASHTWLDSVTLNPVQPGPKPGRLEKMPNCRKAWKDENGDWKESPDYVAVDICMNNQPIKGWPGIVAIRGAKLWGRYLPYGDSSSVRGVIHDDSQWPTPKYIPPKSRLSEGLCVAHIDKCFPDINMDYLRLLLVARGYAESGTGKVPIVLATGPSGSGKTLTAHLAAAILGDVVVRVPKGKYQESVGTAAMKGGIILLDEFAKGLGGSHLRNKFDFLLEIDREFSFRQNYVGPTMAKMNNLILITNNAYGEGVMGHKQFGRRAVYVDLTRTPKEDWTTTCGTGDVRLWRSKEANQVVADSFLSYIVDEFFCDIEAAGAGNLSFTEAAKDLGFNLLQDSGEQDIFLGMDIEDQIRSFYTALASCGDPGERVSQLNGRGWKEFILSDTENPAAQLWRELCDDADDISGRGSSIKIEERDLSLTLGVSLTKKHETIKFYSRRKGKHLFCKFHHKMGLKKDEYSTNEGIITDLKGAARAK